MHTLYIMHQLLSWEHIEVWRQEGRIRQHLGVGEQMLEKGEGFTPENLWPSVLGPEQSCAHGEEKRGGGKPYAYNAMPKKEEQEEILDGQLIVSCLLTAPDISYCENTYVEFKIKM